MQPLRLGGALVLFLLAAVLVPDERAEGRSYLLAYISDSANASPAYWVAKEKGIFKKHGLDIELIYISGSDPKAAKAKVEDFMDLRFVDEIKKSGFLAQLGEKS